MTILLKNMAKVILPPEHKNEVLSLYTYEHRDGTTLWNYIYQDGVAYLPLNLTKLNYVARLLGKELVDERSQGSLLKEPFKVNPEFTFRPHQVEPSRELLEFTLKNKYSLLKADCGLGKTIVNTWASGFLGNKTLVLVDQSNLSVQWLEAYQTVWGRTPQLLSGKNCASFDDVVVSTFQFLHSNPDVVKRAREEFGTCICDEFHGAPAPTFRAILCKLSNQYRLGTSATIIRKGYSPELITDLIADVSVTMTDDKALVPTIQFINTGVDFCSNNPDDFTKILTKLAESDTRNNQIIELVRELVADGRRILLVGTRVEGLTYLQKEMSKFCKALLYVGTTTHKQDQAMKDGIAKGEIDIVLSEKKFEKGLDAPRLDTLIICKPSNNEATITQIVGRILRSLEGKPTPTVYDFVDTGSLSWRFAKNRYFWYKKSGYKMPMEHPIFLGGN